METFINHLSTASTIYLTGSISTGNRILDNSLIALVSFILIQSISHISKNWRSLYNCAIYHLYRMKNYPLEIWRAPYLYDFEMTNDTFLKTYTQKGLHWEIHDTFKNLEIKLTFDWTEASIFITNLYYSLVEKSKITPLKENNFNILGSQDQSHHKGKFPKEGIYLIAIDPFGDPIYISTNRLLYYKSRSGYLHIEQHLMNYLYNQIKEHFNTPKCNDAIYKYNFKKSGQEDSYNSKSLKEIGKISKKKTFDVLFYAQKDELIHILDKFKSGNMYPPQVSMDNKLGILLYGPPGTGKTGTISAIANYLQRNITIVNFTEISSVEELDIILNPERYKETIFVFDEFDCVMDVIGKVQESKTETTDWGSMLLAAEGEERKQIIQMMKDGKKSFKNTINIAYLLQKLDGLERAEGRVIIATTNNPDKINPALLRPGRFDLKLCLGNCSKEIIGQILENFYRTENDVYNRVKKEKITEFKYSPLEIINLAMQNSLGDLLKKISDE